MLPAPQTEMIEQLNILLIEDSPADQELLRRCLRGLDGYAVSLQCAETLADGIDVLGQAESIDLIIADLGLPDSDGIDTFRDVHAVAPKVPAIVVTGMNVEELGLEAVREGAEDYLVKGFITGHEMMRSVLYAIERSRRRVSEAALSRAEADYRIAHEIQTRLYPQQSPAVKGFDIAGRSRPADAVGGDYFDYLSTIGGHLGIVVGDAAGHGLGPALLMAEARACLNSFAISDNCPGVILTWANKVLCGSMPDNRYVTLILVDIDPQTCTMTYANAGHVAGWLLDASGELKMELPRCGFPLGIDSDAEYDVGSPIRLKRGDLMLLITDGIVESVSPQKEYFGFDRLRQTLRDHVNESADQIADALVAGAIAFGGAEQLMDDLTVVVVKVE